MKCPSPTETSAGTSLCMSTAGVSVLPFSFALLKLAWTCFFIQPWVKGVGSPKQAGEEEQEGSLLVG